MNIPRNLYWNVSFKKHFLSVCLSLSLNTLHFDIHVTTADIDLHPTEDTGLSFLSIKNSGKIKCADEYLSLTILISSLSEIYLWLQIILRF